MGLAIDQTEGRLRFDRLLTGAGTELHDRPLLSCDEWLLAPTLGSIVPGWFLLIPRQPVLSLREWAALGGMRVAEILPQLARHLNLELSDMLWFEHGPARAATVVGCGLDHAHLHLLIKPTFLFDAFCDAAYASADLDWRRVPSSDVYSRLQVKSSYLVAGCGDHAISAVAVEAAGSQFFRRVVARLAGNAAQWNYREYPHEEKIRQSVVNFRRLESFSSCDC